MLYKVRMLNVREVAVLQVRIGFLRCLALGVCQVARHHVHIAQRSPATAAHCSERLYSCPLCRSVKENPESLQCVAHWQGKNSLLS